MASTSVIGFDSAWTDDPKKPGAVCVFRLSGDGRVSFVDCQMASFDQALIIVRREQVLSKKCLVALDQPTIVPNVTGCRPVERVAGSLISWMGGGVQPSNRSRKGMFDDDAPIWHFLERLQATEHPELAREAAEGLFLLEVFPALALAGFDLKYCERLAAPKYNPERRKTYKPSDWLDVIGTLEAVAAIHSVGGISLWLSTQFGREKPSKSDQDKVDSVICAFIGLHWLAAPRNHSMRIGDIETGYIVAPAMNGKHLRITSAAARLGVPVDGQVPLS